MPDIEKGIPMPEPRETQPYPWGEMEVGDSFLARTNNVRTVGPMCTKAARKTGFKFAYRKTEEGIRVWRVE